MPDDRRLSDALAELARTVVADFSVEDVLQRMVTAAAGVLDVAGAGVLLDATDGSPRIVAAGDRGVRELEEIQAHAGEGPCLEALSAGRPVSVPDLAADDRFPRYSARACALGFGAAHAFPLRFDGRVLGALSLYAHHGGALDEDDHEAAQLLADVVAAYLLAARVRSESESHARELAHRVLHDPLTGLPNRTLFADRLEHARRRHARDRICAAVLFVDVDRFKAINDAHGHHAGDAVLVAIAGRLTEALRPGDTLSRLSGDEFAVLCEDLRDAEQACAVAQRVVDAVGGPIGAGEVALDVTVSVGVASTFHGPEVAESMLLHADAAMYRAKRRGGGCYAVAGGALGRDVERRRSIVRDLVRAIEDDTLALHYQPIVDRDGRCMSVEALLRWRHPTAGAIPPPLVVEVAASTGVLPQLTSWIVRTALAQIARWRDDGHPDLSVAVNAAGPELVHPAFAGDIAEALADARLPSSALCLEITEETLIQDLPAALGAVRMINDLGVGIALDDFGTGYSSLSYVKHFPIGTIKIDRTFVDGLDGEPVDRAIVGSVVHLADALGLTIIAEGVETAAQMALVGELGCHRIQGHLVAEPRTAATVFAATG